METLIFVVHYVLCIFLIIVILLQAGKGADIGAVFGGGSQTVFGGRGPATFLSKMTAVVAIAFLGTSITLAQISKKQSMNRDTVLDRTPITDVQKAAPVAAPVEESAPAPAPTSDSKETPKK